MNGVRTSDVVVGTSSKLCSEDLLVHARGSKLERVTLRIRGVGNAAVGVETCVVCFECVGEGGDEGELGHASQRSECVGKDVLGMISRCYSRTVFLV
jgi:hypothetical protein